MTLGAAMAIIIGFGVLVLAGIAWGWSRRVRRDRGLVAPTDVPEHFVAEASFSGFYVATTRHEKPLDRLAIRHLRYRGRVGIEVSSAGVLLAITGEAPVFVAASRIVGVDRATWTIDRVVERDGLVRLAWRVDTETIADSYVRMTGDAPGNTSGELLAAVTRILPQPTPTGKAE
ncbi:MULTISPECIES: PH-like domain-containing protein [Bacteria]